jgi:hypothetical protein
MVAQHKFLGMGFEVILAFEIGYVMDADVVADQG